MGLACPRVVPESGRLALTRADEGTELALCLEFCLASSACLGSCMYMATALFSLRGFNAARRSVLITIREGARLGGELLTSLAEGTGGAAAETGKTTTQGGNGQGALQAWPARVCRIAGLSHGNQRTPAGLPWRIFNPGRDGPQFNSPVWGVAYVRSAFVMCSLLSLVL